MRPTSSRVAVLASLFLAITSHSAAAAFRWLEPAPQGNRLNDIAFLDDNTAIAVGGMGTIVITHNAGATWSTSFLEWPGLPWVVNGLSSIARVNASTALIASDAG